MYQQVIIVGNVGRDPELKYLQDGTAVCNFSVAVSKTTGSGDNRQTKTVWFDCAAWRQLAELVNQYVSKGRQVMVVGEIDVRAYARKDGTPGASLVLTARDVKFLGGGGGDNGSPAGEPESMPF